MYTHMNASRVIIEVTSLLRTISAAGTAGAREQGEQTHQLHLRGMVRHVLEVTSASGAQPKPLHCFPT